jgi:hypothetical protein
VGNLKAIDMSTNTVINTINVSPSVSGIAYAPDGTSVWVLDLPNAVAHHYDGVTLAFLGQASIVSDPYSYEPFIGPNIIVGNTPYQPAGASDLDTAGFLDWIPFNGGSLAPGSAITTSRGLSFLAGGGTIDTSAGNLTVSGNMVGEGTAFLTGSGRIMFSGTATPRAPATISSAPPPSS